MDGGRIVEQGNHAELLATRGAYHALYHAQFAAAVAPNEPRVRGRGRDHGAGSDRPRGRGRPGEELTAPAGHGLQLTPGLGSTPPRKCRRPSLSS